MRLIDADALKKEWSMANKCEECPQDARKCQYEQDFSRMDICEMLDEAPTVGGWISVKDRLPEKHGHYLVIRDNGYMSVDTYSRSSHWGKDVCKITHWMPLPEPPEEAKS